MEQMLHLWERHHAVQHLIRQGLRAGDGNGEQCRVHIEAHCQAVNVQACRPANLQLMRFDMF